MIFTNVAFSKKPKAFLSNQQKPQWFQSVICCLPYLSLFHKKHKLDSTAEKNIRIFIINKNKLFTLTISRKNPSKTPLKNDVYPFVSTCTQFLIPKGSTLGKFSIHLTSSTHLVQFEKYTRFSLRKSVFFLCCTRPSHQILGIHLAKLAFTGFYVKVAFDNICRGFRLLCNFLVVCKKSINQIIFSSNDSSQDLKRERKKIQSIFDLFLS